MKNINDLTQYEAAERKRTAFSLVLLVIVVPLTLAVIMFAGTHINYIYISLFILFYTAIPFFMVFEKRKPKAREIVIISTMTAFAVAANLLCTYTIPLYAGTAIVIISGIALGPESGFLIGALSRFICNFFTGQGLWTPWQMIAWGILGFLAGMCFNRPGKRDEINSTNFKIILGPVVSVIFFLVLGYIIYLFTGKEGETFFGFRLYLFGFLGLVFGMIIQKKRLPADSFTLFIFTFFTVFIIYGGLMNIAAMFLGTGFGQNEPVSLKMLKIVYISGVPYDLLHSFGASLCIYIFGNYIIRKIERIKIKFGMYR